MSQTLKIMSIMSILKSLSKMSKITPLCDSEVEQITFAKIDPISHEMHVVQQFNMAIG